jgi:small-conductance mechanosensitive channel
MSRRAERARGQAAALTRRLALVLGVALALILGGAAAAQDPAQPGVPPEWEGTVERAEGLVADPDAATPALELVRDDLLRLRSAAIAFETAAQARVADVNARLAALGPAPAEGAEEGPEIAARRELVNRELAAVQVPLLEAQDFQRRADAVIRQIDQIVLARFTAELRSHGPTPLRPGHWADAADAVADNLRRMRQEAAERLEDPVTRGLVASRLPLDLAVALVGIVITFGLRRRIVEAVEQGLSRATSPRGIALLLFLRNVGKLIVPAVGAGLLFGALGPARLSDPGGPPVVFDLPDFLLVLIGASWLGSSLFAPRLAAYRLAPLADAEAAAAARTVLLLGAVLGAHLLLRRAVQSWDLTAAETAALSFPVVVAGGLVLWRASRMLRGVRRAVAQRDRGAGPGERAGTIGLGVLEIVERGVFVIAFAGPLLAAAGYLAAANYLVFSAILTLGLIGAGVVLFDLVTTLIGALGGPRAEGPGERRPDFGREGLAPVLVAALLGIGALPLLALIWGARTSDIATVWYMLRDGVNLGGMRISFGMIVSFAIVFGAIVALTRLLQSVLRNTVLPRTRMDAGGKNAILAGVGYAGFCLAAVAAVSSTGIDLTSLAFVAGALSVGIGFGLQNIVSNFVSGIILLVERPIKEGDWIEVGGFAGYVRGISVRSTEIETFDRASVILPNSDLVAGTVLNRTHAGMSGRIQVPVSVDLESDPRRVEEILLGIAEAHPLVLTAPSPRVLLMEVGPDSLLFEIRCWLRDVNFSLTARSDMNFEIVEKLAAAGVRLQPYLRDARTPPPAEPPDEEAAPPPAAAPPALAKRS